MEKNKIKVTVLMSVYDGEHPQNLRQSLQSLENQTFKEFELILIIDGPINNELNQIILDQKKQFLRKNINFKCFQLEKTSGLSDALNFGLSKINTKYVARMDSDDYARADRLEQQLNFATMHPDVALFGSNVAEFSKNPCEILNYSYLPKKSSVFMFFKN